MHPILKPLLASRSLDPPVKVVVKGSTNDPICQNLRLFLKDIGHGVANNSAAQEYENNDDGELKLVDNHITVLVLDSIPSRDKYLNKDEHKLAKILQNSIVVYSGPENPFADGSKVGNLLGGYLVLTMKDCGLTLADNILSGVAVRTVKYLHHGHEELV